MKPGSLPTGTVTFLMTDVEGSTRLWERHTEAMMIALARHEHLIRDSVCAHGGSLPKLRGEGDSLFAIFERASDALRSAVEIQRTMADEPWPEEIRLRVRMGLHSGEADLRGGDYYGPAVNRCARIRAAAHGGQILLSDSTRQLVVQHLPEGVRLKDHGLQRLRDLLQPERIYEVLAEGLPADLPRPRTLDQATHNLPVQLTSFVGRETEIAEVKLLLFKHRLVTLTGAGGSGKTRLSLQVAAELADEFVDGVWFVELVGLSDGKLIAQTIAAARGVDVTQADPVDALVEDFREEPALLVLDNCEHLVRDAAGVVNRLLRECPRLTVLATSREPLGVAGECSYLVPPLEADLRGEMPTLESVGALDSVKLFCDRAASRIHDPVLTEGSAASVQRLCKRLDGIPLAIEQAASNLDYLSPTQILDRLERHMSLLEIREEGVDPRHVTLQATIDWSFGMLSEEERLLFLRLSVFVGGFSLEAAESVCGFDGLSQSSVMSLLQRLVRKSLVMAEETSRGLRRFRLLETIREYAVQKRREVLGADDSLERRHFDWFHHLALAAEEQGSLDRDGGSLLHILELEHDNVRAALDWGAASERMGVAVLETCVGMHRFWIRRGHILEGTGRLQTALEGAREAQDALRGSAMNILGALALYRKDLAAAQRAFEQALKLFEKCNLPGKLAAVHSNLGLIAQQLGQHAKAREQILRAIQQFEAAGDLLRAASAWVNVGSTFDAEGCYEDAARAYKKALKLARDLRATGPTAIAYQNYLGAVSKLGRLSAHLDEVAECIEIALESGDTHACGGILDILAAVAVERAEEARAALFLAAADLAYHEAGSTLEDGEERYREPLQARVSQGFGRTELGSIRRRAGAQGWRRVLSEGLSWTTASA